jgi:hydroxymethylpyrimidine pyrophosphatase-like HAD family hydrolase
MKRLIAFDIDGALAESKQAIDAEMGDLLAITHRLLGVNYTSAQ